MPYTRRDGQTSNLQLLRLDPGCGLGWASVVAEATGKDLTTTWYLKEIQCAIYPGQGELQVIGADFLQDTAEEALTWAANHAHELGGCLKKEGREVFGEGVEEWVARAAFTCHALVGWSSAWWFRGDAAVGPACRRLPVFAGALDNRLLHPECSCGAVPQPCRTRVST